MEAGAAGALLEEHLPSAPRSAPGWPGGAGGSSPDPCGPGPRPRRHPGSRALRPVRGAGGNRHRRRPSLMPPHWTTSLGAPGRRRSCGPCPGPRAARFYRAWGWEPEGVRQDRDSPLGDINSSSYRFGCAPDRRGAATPAAAGEHGCYDRGDRLLSGDALALRAADRLSPLVRRVVAATRACSPLYGPHLPGRAGHVAVSKPRPAPREHLGGPADALQGKPSSCPGHPPT